MAAHHTAQVSGFGEQGLCHCPNAAGTTLVLISAAASPRRSPGLQLDHVFRVLDDRLHSAVAVSEEAFPLQC